MSKYDKYKFLFTENYNQKRWDQFLNECFMAKDLRIAAELLNEGVKHYGPRIEILWSLALCYMSMQALEKFEETLKLCIDKHESHAPSYILLAELYSKRNLHQKAKRYFSRAYKVEPSVLTRAYFDSAPPFIKNGLNLARFYLYDDYRVGLENILKDLSKRGDTTRLAKCFDIYLGKLPKDVNAMFNPEQLLFPDIRREQFYSPDEFPLLEKLKLVKGEVEAEFHKINKPFDEYINLHSNNNGTILLDQFKDYDTQQWTSFHLYRYGKNEDNCSLCPVTANTLKEIGLPNVSGFMPEAFFSRLSPKAKIPPHYGLSNVRLAVHWPIVTNDDAFIDVGGVRKEWVLGEPLIFDDSYLHFAENGGEQDRTVLILDTWHPDLTEIERQGITKVFDIKTITNIDV